MTFQPRYVHTGIVQETLYEALEKGFPMNTVYVNYIEIIYKIIHLYQTRKLNDVTALRYDLSVEWHVDLMVISLERETSQKPYLERREAVGARKYHMFFLAKEQGNNTTF